MAESKVVLRARIRTARSASPDPHARARAGAGLLATARAAGLLDLTGVPAGIGGASLAACLAAYIAAPGEPDVAAIRTAWRGAGGVVLLPIPQPDRTLDWARDDGSYRPDPRLPVEVPRGEVVGTGAVGLLTHGVRTLLVPALAVDATGARLGQGGGYYDRLLRELADLTQAARGDAGAAAGPTSGGGVRVVAVVRDEEVLPAGSVPREAHDQVMMAVLTPTRFVEFDT